MTSHRSLVLLSGGLDSSVATWLAKEAGHRIELVLTYDYGRGIRAKRGPSGGQARGISGSSSSRDEAPVVSRAQWRGSALESSIALPRPTEAELGKAEFIEKSAAAVWVPNRNGTFLEIAAGLAESMRLSSIIVGFNREEATTFPDNSLEYLDAINEALKFSTNGTVQVVSPTATLDKREIVARAKQLDFPFSLLWSCYESGEKMCGTCESCQRLKRALLLNEVVSDELFQNPS